MADPTSNLRLYMQRAIIPEIRVAKEKDYFQNQTAPSNNLDVQPQPYRILKTMKHFDPKMNDKAASTWVKEHVPASALSSSSTDKGKGAKITLPVPGSGFRNPYELTYETLGRAQDMETARLWLETFPLATVERILHLLGLDSKWRFRATKLPNDNLTHFYKWSPGSDPARDSEEINTRCVLVMFQPQWNLTDYDLDQFVATMAFPPYTTPGQVHVEPLTRTYKIWAKLWDTCVGFGVRSFVLTSYRSWVFGCFSAAYDYAGVSQVYSHDAKTPTVIESLTFFMASAMNFREAHGFPIYKVYEEYCPHFSIPTIQPRPTIPLARRLPITDSRDWENPMRRGMTPSDYRSTTPGISAFCGSVVAAQDDNGQYLSAPFVNDWVQDQSSVVLVHEAIPPPIPVVDRLHPEPFNARSPTPSSTITIGSAVWGKTEPQKTNIGTWMC